MAKVKIYGRMTNSDGSPQPNVPIDITYYAYKKPPTTEQVLTNPDGSWETYQRANAVGDFFSHYFFSFQNDVARKVFLYPSAPWEINFDQLIKGIAGVVTTPPLALSNGRTIQQANDFTPLTVLKQINGVYSRAQADTVANADMWLCLAATGISFRLANTYTEYYFPNHGLGDSNQILYLSPTTPGALTKIAPTVGQARAILGVVIDANYLLWAPDLIVEIVT
jgi:hypothetical protein